jgi:hypothetical protein
MLLYLLTFFMAIDILFNGRKIVGKSVTIHMIILVNQNMKIQKKNVYISLNA